MDAMSTTEAPKAAPVKRGCLRFWLPFFILGFAAATLAVLWLAPLPGFGTAERNLSTVALGFLTVLLLLVWLALFSGFRWYVRLGVPLAVVGLWFGLVREAEVT